MPIDLLISIAVGSSSGDSEGSMLQMIRVMRVAKLARILRASRIYNRWIDHFGLSYAFQSIWKFLIITVILAHWMACWWGFWGRRANANSPDTWHARMPEELQQYSHGDAQYEGAGVLYGVCLYVALTNIFGGSCEINPANAQEYYLQSLMMLCGSCVWAYVIGSCCGILATLNPALIEYRQTMDELNVFVKDHDMPQDLTVRLRSYFRNTMQLIRTRRYEQLLNKMSRRLRGDASYIVAKRAFKRISYLSHPSVEVEFLCLLTTRFRLAVYSRLEWVSTSNLFIIDRGVCAKKGKIALVGSCLGEDMIIALDWLRDLKDAIALTFLQTIYLPRDAIFDLLPGYPEAYKVIRRQSIKYAFRRYIIRIADAAISEAKEAEEAVRGRVSDEGTPASSALTIARTSKLKGMSVTVSVSEAMAALERKRAKEDEKADTRKEADAFGGVQVGMYEAGTKAPAVSEAPPPVLVTRMNDRIDGVVKQQAVEIDSLKAQLGSLETMLDGKFDALTQTIGALALAVSNKPRMRAQRSRLAAAPDDTAVCRQMEALSSAATCAPSHGPPPLAKEPRHGRTEELAEMQDATGAEHATLSSPFEA